MGNLSSVLIWKKNDRAQLDLPHQRLNWAITSHLLKKKEEFLLSKRGLFSIKSGTYHTSGFWASIWFSSSLFQINRLLYFTPVYNGTRHYVSCFFAINYSQSILTLSPLIYPRRSFSLAGLQSILIAVGGLDSKALWTCEQYCIAKNKWKYLPPIQIPRCYPALVLRDSVIAYCFSGGLALE